MEFGDRFNLGEWVINHRLFVPLIGRYHKRECFVNALDTYFAIKERYAKSEKELQILVQVVVKTEWVDHRQQLGGPLAVLEILDWYVDFLRLLIVVSILAMVMMMMMAIRFALR